MACYGFRFFGIRMGQQAMGDSQINLVTYRQLSFQHKVKCRVDPAFGRIFDWHDSEVGRTGFSQSKNFLYA